MESSRIATTLDEERLAGSGIAPEPASTPDADLPSKSGAEVAAELGGRLLLRYLTPAQVGIYTNGSDREHYVTPTPYAPDEAIRWLALPGVTVPREHALVLDPSSIDVILGPRKVRWGGGIEYILPDGFPKGALHFAWEVVVA